MSEGEVEAVVRLALKREVLSLYRERLSIAVNFKVKELLVEEGWSLRTARELQHGRVSQPKWLRDAAIAIMQALRTPFDVVDRIVDRMFGKPV
jgi:hypothetical protein